MKAYYQCTSQEEAVEITCCEQMQTDPTNDSPVRVSAELRVPEIMREMGEYVVLASQRYHKDRTLTDDSAAYQCWEMQLRSSSRDSALVYVRRKCTSLVRCPPC